MTNDWARHFSLLQGLKTCSGDTPGVCAIGTAGGKKCTGAQLHNRTTQLHPHCLIIQMECVSFPSPLECVLSPPPFQRPQKHGTSGASFSLHHPVFRRARNSRDVRQCVTRFRLRLSCHDTGRVWPTPTTFKAGM